MKVLWTFMVADNGEDGSHQHEVTNSVAAQHAIVNYPFSILNYQLPTESG